MRLCATRAQEWAWNFHWLEPTFLDEHEDELIDLILSTCAAAQPTLLLLGGLTERRHMHIRIPNLTWLHARVTIRTPAHD